MRAGKVQDGQHATRQGQGLFRFVIRISVHEETAVDVQNLAGDEGCLVGCQEQDGFGDVLRPTQAFQRDGFDDGLALFGRPFGAHFRCGL
jgi:hypothetical protein